MHFCLTFNYNIIKISKSIFKSFFFYYNVYRLLWSRDTINYSKWKLSELIKLTIRFKSCFNHLGNRHFLNWKFRNPEKFCNHIINPSVGIRFSVNVYGLKVTHAQSFPVSFSIIFNNDNLDTPWWDTRLNNFISKQLIPMAMKSWLCKESGFSSNSDVIFRNNVGFPILPAEHVLKQNMFLYFSQVQANGYHIKDADAKSSFLSNISQHNSFITLRCILCARQFILLW